MKKIILASLVMIMGCKSSVKKSSSDSNKTILIRKDSINPTQKIENINHAPKLNTYYFLWGYSSDINALDFIYFINDSDCMIYKTKMLYDYDRNTGLITIRDVRNNNEPIYFQILTASGTAKLLNDLQTNMKRFEETYNLPENRNDNNYSLVSLVMSNGQYVKGDNNGHTMKLYLSEPSENAPNLNSLINKTISGEKSDLNNMLERLKSDNLILENKMDFIQDKGLEQVNQILLNKIDLTYESLFKQWKELNQREHEFEKLDESIKPNYTIKEYLKNSVLVDVLGSYPDIRTLSDDFNNFGKTLDNEVLPLLQQTNSNPN